MTRCCSSRRSPTADRDDKLNVKPLMIHVVEFDWRHDLEFGQIQAYVCRACGFTELYTAGADKLPVAKIPGARVFKAGT